MDKRPKFGDLVNDPFIKYIEKETVDVASWYNQIIEQEAAKGLA